MATSDVVARRIAVLVVLLALGAARPGAEPAAPVVDDAAAGAALFEGRADLRGKIRGHSSVLPPHASRCSNCHLTVETPVSAASATRLTQTFGPALTPTRLTGLRARRGAPPTRYDLTAFCTVLRTGVDPSKVVLARTMPLYELDDRSCQALWTHLTGTRP